MRSLIITLSVCIFVSSSALAEPLALRKIALVGDSIVAKPPEQVPALERRGWGEFLTSPSWEVSNFAKGGESSASYRGVDEKRWNKVFQKSPQVVLIEFGHNDRSKMVMISEYKANLAAYIDDARAKGAIPILVTPPPRKSEDNKRLQDDLDEYASAMKEVGRDKTVDVIDLHGRWREKQAAERGSDFFSKYYNSADNTHFNAAGAEALAKIVKEELGPILQKSHQGTVGENRSHGTCELEVPKLSFPELSQ